MACSACIAYQEHFFNTIVVHPRFMHIMVLEYPAHYYNNNNYHNKKQNFWLCVSSCFLIPESFW